MHSLPVDYGRRMRFMKLCFFIHLDIQVDSVATSWLGRSSELRGRGK